MFCALSGLIGSEDAHPRAPTCLALPGGALTRFRWSFSLPAGLARVLDAVVVPVCLGPVAAGGHGAPPAGAVAGGVVEPQDAGRVLAAADPVRCLFEQLEEAGRGHDRGVPCGVVDLQR